jgi:hypothetical protein
MKKDQVTALRKELSEQLAHQRSRPERYDAARYSAICQILLEVFPLADAALAHLTDEQLVTLENNFRHAGVQKSRDFTLRDIRREKLARYPLLHLTPAEMVQRIVDLCRASADHQTTFGDLWTSFTGDKRFTQSSMNQLGRLLAVIGLHCVEENIPNASVMVVNKGTRELSVQATRNIWEWLRENEVSVPACAAEYAEQQKQLFIARLLTMPSSQPLAA